MFSSDGYQTLRTSVGFVRRTDRGVIRVAGTERAPWLQGLLTCDVPAIAVGRRGYGAWLTPQGRMITDLWVAPRPTDLLLDVPAPLAAALHTRLDGLIFAEDVQIDDVSASVAVAGVYGPTSGDWGAAQDSAGAWVVPDTDLQIPGFAVYGDVGAHTLPEVGLDTFDIVRIESGVPAFLVDMTEETIPLEAGIEDRAISFTKGCYVGQEVIVRVTHRGGGRVAKKLVGLVCVSADVTAATLSSATIDAGARTIGRVTSAAFSPLLQRTIALGYVHRDFIEPGSEVTISGAPATVVTLPFAGTSARQDS